MNFDFVTNLESCYVEIPNILYYSHIPTIIIASFFAFFVVYKNKELAGRILFILALAFSLWALLNLVVWIGHDSRIIMLSWSFFGILSAIIYLSSLYFVCVFLNKGDISFGEKVIIGLLLLPLIFLTPTAYSLLGFDVVSCEASENKYFTDYYYFLGFFVFVWILILSFLRYLKATPVFRKQIIYLTIGIESFLLSFFTTGYFATLFDNFKLEQYGLFGMTFFMGTLAFLVVRYHTFNIKLIGAQALVISLIILIGSQFFFIKTTMNFVLTGITFVLAIGFGWMLIRSVKSEVKRKEELQKISDALAIANQRLKELDLTKSEFISIASHQLRTPLTAIKGYISLLLEGSYGEVSATVQDVLDKVYSVNSRLVRLVEDLLNVSRIEAGRIQYSFAKTQLEPLVAELVDMFTPTARNKKLALKMKLPEKALPQLTLDPNKIKEVLSNLIDNALKYTKEGSVTVTLEGSPNVARIIVSDTGIGIRPEDEKSLFEKFIRTKETTKMVASGAGLGLYVGRNFVEAHGGKIWAESDGPDKGSRFIIELPFVNPKIHIGTSDQPSPSEKK